ncbi:MAG: hypothetical protein NTX50_22175 [Candidatus Sumerlaeota bacterium]|nr:hypothetical protein [Candidatus Sumerlaeota bacterium]
MVRKWSIALLICAGAASLKAAPIMDAVIFGDMQSEASHQLAADHSDVIKGGLDEPARRLLPLEPQDWQGGKASFTIKVDPVKQNYFTIRLWGSDTGDGSRLILYCEGKQIGYRHLGDIDILDTGASEPAYTGRFFYNTSPLPLAMTQGKTQLKFEIRSTGRIWGYGTNWEQYQKNMTAPSRGLYRAYTHTDGFFAPPSDEKQGEPPANPPARKEPGEEVLTKIKARVTREIAGALKSNKPLGQLQMQFLARSYHVKWTPAYHNDQAIRQIIKGADEYYRRYKKEPKMAQSDPGMYNPDWFGLGPAGEAIHQLGEPLKPFLDEAIDDGAGQKIARRAAWSQMLQASRDWHNRNRRLYTNQSMINDMATYWANRGVAAIDPAHAMSEDKARRYLYESIGIQPWLGSDGGNGPQKPLGDNYYELTANGLTKELGYVGYYGEVLDWVGHIYYATCDPGKPNSGDEKIRAQLAKMEQARSYFRYPMLDADGNRAMRIETIIGWRDAHYPGDVTYSERSDREGSSIFSAAATLASRSVGAAQQMFADNQFFKSVEELARENGTRITNSLLAIPDQYETLKAQPASSYRLPMTAGQPDFVFSDEEDGVVALKRGEDILYVSLYWRARYAVNFLARVHYITPRFDRIAVVCEETQFEPSGMQYTRPDWVNMGFGNGGLRYPGNLHSAHAGEKLPIAQIPAGIKFKPGDENVYAGRGSFYRLQYGSYLIGMNTTKDKTFEMKAAAGMAQAQGQELISGEKIDLTIPLKVAPLSTVVLWLGM